MVNNQRKIPLVLVCDGIRGPANAGGLIRLAEAFGLEKVYFSKNGFNVDGYRFKRASRGCERFVDFEVCDDLIDIIHSYKSQGYKIIGLEITNDSISLAELKKRHINKVILIVGAERTGISQNILPFIDLTIHINMHGKNSSMNVGHAAAISIYQLQQALHDTGKI